MNPLRISPIVVDVVEVFTTWQGEVTGWDANRIAWRFADLDGRDSREILDRAYIILVTLGFQAQHAESWVRMIAEETDLQYVPSDIVRDRAAIACGSVPTPALIPVKGDIAW